MTEITHEKSRVHSSVTRMLTAVFCMAFVAPSAVADFDPNEIHSRIVRIEVKTSGEDRVGSGFIWQQSDRVVTSLHTVLGATKITVQCKQTESPAEIVSMHTRADLVLLKTNPFPSNCKPFESVVTDEPRNSQKLHTMGYMGRAFAATTRSFTKEWAAPPVTVARIVGKNENVLSKLRRLGTPDVDNLPIYYVQGGLLPGYSGAPIIDTSGNLVAVVDGGLTGGTTDYNWAIPGKHLNELASMGLSQMPSGSGDVSGTLFSFGGAASEQAAKVDYEIDGRAYLWVKTKTVSLAEVLQYSDTLDLDSVRDLLYEHEHVFGSDAEDRLQFDIYEDIDNGLVIATPAKQKLNYDYEDEWLTSAAPDDRDGSIQYKMIDWGLTTQSSIFIEPTDPGYFDATIADVLSECNVRGESSCVLIEGSREDYDYDYGNKVLNFAIEVQEDGYDPQYEHYSVAVRGRDNIAFQTYARFDWAYNDIYACTEDPRQEGCTNSATAFTNLQQILAVHMSTTSRFYRPMPPMNLRVE